MVNGPSVIIVGAGPAGIAAAAKLLENGITNITILEAEARIGGRIHSVKFGDSLVDLGAEWCHGEEKNILYSMVKQLNLLKPVSYPETFFSSSREPVDQNFARELYKLGEQIYYKGRPDEEITVGEYIKDRFISIVSSKYDDDQEIIQFAKEMLNTFRSEVLAVEGCFTWHDPAAKTHYEDCDERQTLSWNGNGCKTILNVLMKEYPDPSKKLPVLDKIILNKEVVEIAWGATPVTVKCLDRSQYRADHVIVTVSLGVLKDRHASLFNPMLPDEKINAIEELGIGAVTKVFLHFPNKWWPDDITNIVLLWNTSDREKLFKEFPKGPHDQGQSWLGDLFLFLTVDNNPNVLVAWFAGTFILEIELLADDILTEGIMFILEKFVGHQFKITRPDQILRYNWYLNPHFRGVYSFATTKSRKRDVIGAVALLRPLATRSGKLTLLFAGEATNPTHYGTVHGAVESGFREADRIIKLHRLNVDGHSSCSKDLF